ncbi:MAG: DUF4013 domain-containing protein [Deltaproteobacteria bacterium]|nr:DUF4013 domain-containing protein [Deltaproteobacteria bacterium]
MNIERSIVFIFNDKQWPKKVLLGGVFSLLFFTVFFAFVVAGYVMRVFCNALEGRDANLPDWDDLGGFFNEGLLPVMIGILYTVPFIALFILEQIVHAIVGFSFSAFLVFGMVNLFINALVGLVISVLFPLGMVRFAVKRSTRAAFEFRHIFDFIKRNPGTYLTAWAVSTFLFGLIGAVGLVGLFVGVAVTGFASALMSAHLYAAAYRASRPFADDRDGELRASMALPPPLH